MPGPVAPFPQRKASVRGRLAGAPEGSHGGPIGFLRKSSVCSYGCLTAIGDGIRMEPTAGRLPRCGHVPLAGDRPGFSRDRNNATGGRVGSTELCAPVLQEDQTISTPSTSLRAPASMSRLQHYADNQWVEASDEPQGTAVFDATGDKAAMPSWEELVRQHADRVYRLAYRLSGNQQDAEDLTQETFIRVFRSVQNYQPGTFEGWLHRITTNLFLDMVRRRGRIRMEALPDDYDRVPAEEPNPEQIFHDARLGPDLQAALDSLAPEFRAAVVLCDVEGLSYEEIGATLGVKLGTVRSRIHRGRQALRDYLAAHSDQGIDAAATAQST